jgi:hypothetical protein
MRGDVDLIRSFLHGIMLVYENSFAEAAREFTAR